ncbi:MAG: EAL domain-containing protein [Betaproteobacteria bacterium]|nr:EAL domain-containing protein [Betaproteobacteria bacterium]
MRLPALSLSISRIAVLYILLVVMMLGLLWGYFWYEINTTGARLLRQHETNAKLEIRDAFLAVERDLRKAGDKLADWDETRQQLAIQDYYSIWRDVRIRGASLHHEAMDDVALYSREGRILARSLAPDPLPERIPVTQAVILLLHDQNHSHMVYYRPVHADPSGTVLLGYLAMKLDLTVAMKQLRSFRYAALDSLILAIPAGAQIDVRQAADIPRVRPLPDPDMNTKQRLFKQAMTRQALVMLAALLLAVLLLRFWLVRPLRGLSTEISNLTSSQEQDAPLLQASGPLRVLELESLRTSFNAYRQRLRELHGHLEQKSRDFYDQARRDALSGAFNRRAFEEDWLRIAEDRRTPAIALLLFDCDHFKAINDTYGHHVGDSVIQATAQCLQSALRTQDRLYRLGGDEFAMLLRDNDPAQAEMVAERCLEHITKHDFYQYGMREPISISVGIAFSQGDQHSLTALQKHADLAMYSAKRPGSRKIVFYGDDMEDMEVLVSSREVNAVFRAIRDPSCIEMSYQGVQRLPRAEKEYVEALVRVRYDEDLLGPAALFPIIQSRGLDVEFDQAVINAIRHDMQSGRLPADQGVSINLSAPSVVNSKAISAMLDLIRAENGRKIVVEITETALITQMDIATSHIKQLREAGALVALDDFGSGYSSLRYLSSMPVDLVKFDISMVHMLESDDERQRLITEEIAAMVMSAGYAVVAEGIETLSLLERVTHLGFSHAQGYYFGKPER